MAISEEEQAALIASPRVSRRTRAVLQARAAPPGAGCLPPHLRRAPGR